MIGAILLRCLLPLGLIVTIFEPVCAAELTGRILDGETGELMPARVYVRDSAGNWLFVESASSDGSALPYREQWVPMPDSIERHTTVSAHPFRIELEPGVYEITIERGKEYVPITTSISMGDVSLEQTFRLQRWVNMAERGWFSGETHVHRRIEELPNVMLAEDLNVAFPVTFWTTQSGQAPGLEPSPLRRQGPSPFGPRLDRGAERIPVDATHVMFPRNTEYEIFSVDGMRHVLGAVFVLNHKTAFTDGMPPVGGIAAKAHAEGALLDLDKHSWPWSMMLVPVARVDLYELSNNSVWRTRFGFRRSGKPPAWMDVEVDEGGMTEWGWLNYGFENYYLLLNCGFRLQPTAGTASGVHPVPLGYSRVYVHTGKRFDADEWFDGLRRGRSFVSTGPMLPATLDDELPGEVFRQSGQARPPRRLRFDSISRLPVDRVEVVVNGQVRETLRPPAPIVTNWSGEVELDFDESSWVVLRSFQIGPDGRVRFAHTAPWHIEVDEEPVRPREEEIQYLISRMDEEIARNESVLGEEALAEFTTARATYARIAETAVPDFEETDCQGRYPHHLQGICTNQRDTLFWSFTTRLVSTDRTGKIIQERPVDNHHGDLCFHNGRLLVAVNLGSFNDAAGNADSWVYVYDARTLELLKRHRVPEVFHGAGGVGVRQGRFFVVGGLPEGVPENYIYEYDDHWKFVRRHVLPSGHTSMGIQTATWAHGAWWFGCYGSPRVLLKADADFQLLGRYEFDGALGITGASSERMLVATGPCSATGCVGSIRVAVFDEKRGLQFVNHDESQE